MKLGKKMYKNFHDLTSRYFDGNLMESEQLELKSQLASDAACQKIFEDYCRLWDESGQKAVLKAIDVETELKRAKKRIVFRKPIFIGLIMKAAAVFLLAGLFSSIYIYYFYSPASLIAAAETPKETPAITQEISSMFGTRSKFKLPDGSTVYLNSGSKMVFPIQFKGDVRKVELVGQAFFDVIPNPAKPFVVKTSGIEIKALGTAFDLQAYPGTGEISTTLVHGKIVLENELDGVSKQIAELKPSDRAIYESTSKTVKISAEEDLDKFIAWKDGKLVFFNDPIEKVAEKLGIWYNVTVKINNNEMKHYRFTATFTDEPIEQVLDLLSISSPIKYKIKKASRLSDNSYSKREIIFN